MLGTSVGDVATTVLVQPAGTTAFPGGASRPLACDFEIAARPHAPCTKQTVRDKSNAFERRVGRLLAIAGLILAAIGGSLAEGDSDPAPADEAKASETARIASPAKQARTCSATRITPSTGIPGGPRPWKRLARKTS